MRYVSAMHKTYQATMSDRVDVLVGREAPLPLLVTGALDGVLTAVSDLPVFFVGTVPMAGGLLIL